MIRWIWIAVLWLTSACDEPVQQVAPEVFITDTTHQYPTVLPQALVDYITVHFPQWRLVEKTDYSNTWWSFYDSSYNPCWARTDINDDRLADYALWLKNDSLAQLIICTGTSGHAFTHYIAKHPTILFNENDHNLVHGVAVVPPAQIDVVSPRIQSLILKSNGFALLQLEERTRIYYWQKDSLQTFYMK